MFFRRRTLFHVEERLPDQEDIKLRFRRRVIACALVGFVVVLGFPVLRELQPELHARRETRWLAQLLLESRLMAAKSRAPVALRVNGGKWERLILAKGAGCKDLAASTPAQVWESEGVNWQLKLQRASGDPMVGSSLCVHPLEGLLLENEAVAEGTLLISANPVADTDPSGPRSSHLLISQHGAEIQTINR